MPQSTTKFTSAFLWELPQEKESRQPWHRHVQNCQELAQKSSADFGGSGHAHEGRGGFQVEPSCFRGPLERMPRRPQAHCAPGRAPRSAPPVGCPPCGVTGREP